MAEKGGSIVKSGKKENYSEKYLRFGKLQKTKAWQEVLEEETEDELLLKVHKGLLQNKSFRSKGKTRKSIGES